MYIVVLLIRSSSEEEQLLQAKYTRTEKKPFSLLENRTLTPLSCCDSYSFSLGVSMTLHALTHKVLQQSAFNSFSETVYCPVNALELKYVNMCALVQRNSNSSLPYLVITSQEQCVLKLKRHGMGAVYLHAFLRLTSNHKV